MSLVPIVPPGNEPEPRWGQSLADGAAGIALAHIERAHASGEWATARTWMAAMTCAPVVAAPDGCGLWNGAPSVAFTLHAAAQPGYAPALATLDTHIERLALQRVSEAHLRMDRGELPALREFDLVNGLTGIGAYLLHRHRGGPVLRSVLAYLVRLTQPVTISGEVLPGWWASVDPAGRPSGNGGHANFGMAHGIAGPLTLLALAARRGITVPGHLPAMEAICRELYRWRGGHGQRAWWPETITLGEWRSGTVRQTGPGRPSWCYGTPGLARAQQLAAIVLRDPGRQHEAEAALAGCIGDDRQLSQLVDTSLCHGWAGLVHTVWRAARDAGPAYRDALAGLLPYLQQQMNTGPVPRTTGLLEGSTGLALAELCAATDTPPATRWDACLLLDG